MQIKAKHMSHTHILQRNRVSFMAVMLFAVSIVLFWGIGQAMALTISGTVVDVNGSPLVSQGGGEGKGPGGPEGPGDWPMSAGGVQVSPLFNCPGNCWLFEPLQQDGTFEVSGDLPNGEYEVSVQLFQALPGQTAGDPVRVKVSGKNVNAGNLQLVAPAITGTVKGPGNVAISMNPEQNQFVNLDLYNMDRTVNRNSSTDQDGNFSFGAVPNGTYTIEAQPEGFNDYTTGTTTVTYSGTALTNVTVGLSAPQIRGTVQRTETDTTTVQNAGINVHNENWSVNAFANSDQQGNFTIGGLDESKGPYMAELQVPWGTKGLVSKTFTIDFSKPNVTLFYSVATKTIRGTVRYGDSRPVVNANVNGNVEGGFGFASTQTDENGNYSLSVSAGSWNVNVWPNQGPGQSADWISEGFGKSVGFNNDDSTETQTLDFSVAKATARIIGRVVDKSGNAITDAHVDVRKDDGSGNGSPVNQDGTFDIRVKAGGYRLMILSNDPSLNFPEQKVDVKDDQTLDLGVITASSKDARITGRIVREGTSVGIEGVRVNASPEGPGWSQTQTDVDGNFSIQVTKGRWHIMIDQGWNTQYVYSGPPIDVEVPSNDSVVALPATIGLAFADVTINGSIVDASGNRVNNFCSWAFARPGTGGEEGKGMGPGPEYGGPVDCQQGTFSISVPSNVASTYTIGVHTPPNVNYSLSAAVVLPVLADQTYDVELVMVANDATLTGRLVDQNGTELTSCDFQGDVFASDGSSWKNSRIGGDCTYSISLRSGKKYQVGYWIAHNAGFLETPPRNEKTEISVGTNVFNIPVKRADASITGIVLDPDGNPVSTAMFVFASNFPELHGDDEPMGPPSKEDFENEIFSGSEVRGGGTFSIPVLSGHLYDVNVHFPPFVGGNDFLPPDFQIVDLTNATTGSVTIQLAHALGSMTGNVTIAGQKAPHGFVHCWSEGGGFNGSEVNSNGTFSMNYGAGVWHCVADSFNGTSFYRSPEVVLTITDQTSLTQDFDLTPSTFSVPPSVSATFDATTTKVITLDNGTIINISAGALAESGNVTVTATPTVNLVRTKSDQPFGVGYDLTATDANSQQITIFQSNVTITFPYTEDQLEEVGVTEAALAAKYYDDTQGWQSVSGVTVDTDADTITVSTNHFTKYAIVSTGGVAAASATSSRVKVIVVAPGEGGGPNIRLYDENGELIDWFMAYDSGFRGGVEAIMADLNGDGIDEVITAPAKGTAHLKVFSQDGTLLAQTFVAPQGYRGGLTLATGDVDGDGFREIVTGTKEGGGPQVTVYGYASGTLTKESSFFAYASTLRSGLNVAVGNVDDDAKAEIVTGTAYGAGPHVRIFNYDGTVQGAFFAFPSHIRTGVNVTLADVNADGQREIITTPVMGAPANIAVYDEHATLLSSFFALPTTITTGVTMQAADVDGDGDVEILTAPRAGAGPQVSIFHWKGEVEKRFFAYAEGVRSGMTLRVADLDANGDQEIITAPGAGAGPQVSVFDSEGTAQWRTFAYQSTFRNGITVNTGNQ